MLQNNEFDDQFDDQFDESTVDIENQEELSDEESEYIINIQAPISFNIDVNVSVDEELSDPENYYNNKIIYEKVVGYLKEISNSNKKYSYIRDLSIEFIEIGSKVLYHNELYNVEYIFEDDLILIHQETKDIIKLVNKSELLPNDNSCKNITNKDIKFLFEELISKFTIDKDTIYDIFVSFSNYMKIDVKKVFKSLDYKIQNKITSALNKRI